MDTTDSVSPNEVLVFLQSEGAQATLAHLATLPLRDEDALANITALRRAFAPWQAATLLQQATLRKRARTKFPHAESMYFVEQALEQATSATVAQLHAQQLAAWSGEGAWLDLGCGIGGDLLALAQERPVVAYELDPLRAAFARANVQAVGTHYPVEVRQADWVAALDAGELPHAAAAFVDPARRIGTDGGKREYSLHTIAPPLDAILRLAQHVPLVAVKIMPGVRDEELPAGCSIQFVSHEGVCKEAILWLGAPTPPRRWASVHDGSDWHEIEAAGIAPPLGEVEAGALLYEPDPAVIRAGALAEIAEQLGAWQFDAQIAYLVATGEARPTPFARVFRVIEVHRFSLKLLNERLAALGVGRVEIKKRGFPVEPEELRGRLKLVKGGVARVIFLTRRGEEHVMFIAERIA